MKFALYTLLILIFLSPVAAFQDSTLQIKILDQNSALISNTKSKLKSGENNYNREIKNGKPNEVLFTKLKPGNYRLTIEADGFKPHSQEVFIKQGRNELTVTLDIIEITESVVVSQDDEETSASEVFGGFLTRRQIDALSDDPEEMVRELKQLAGDTDIIIRVDGFSTNRVPPKSKIASIRIVRTSFDAENHELGSTYVDITTRAGNNRWSGSFSTSLSDEALNARNSFAPVRLPEQNSFSSFFIDGPIAKDKTALTITAHNYRNATRQNIVAIVPTGDSELLANFFTGVSRTTVLEAAVLQNFSKNHTGRISYEISTGKTSDYGIGGFNLAERRYSGDSQTHRLRFSESGSIGKDFLMNSEASFTLCADS